MTIEIDVVDGDFGLECIAQLCCPTKPVPIRRRIVDEIDRRKAGLLEEKRQIAVGGADIGDRPGFHSLEKSAILTRQQTVDMLKIRQDIVRVPVFLRTETPFQFAQFIATGGRAFAQRCRID